MAANDQTVFDALINGYRRTVRSLGSDGEELGIQIPADWAAEHGIEHGHQAGLREGDYDHPVLEVHFDE